MISGLLAGVTTDEVLDRLADLYPRFSAPDARSGEGHGRRAAVLAIRPELIWRWARLGDREKRSINAETAARLQRLDARQGDVRRW